MLLKEVFIISADDDQEDPNQWLDESVLPGFRVEANLLYRDCWTLSAQILRALALGLDLDTEDDLLKFHSVQNHKLAFRHYPSIDAEKARSIGVPRLSAHRDFSPSITLLFQDDVGGLEVQRLEMKEGFVPVPPIKDTLVMNVGDVLMRWTNGSCTPSFSLSQLLECQMRRDLFLQLKSPNSTFNRHRTS